MRGDSVRAGFAALLMFACQSSVKGNITVDTHPFDIATCRSGEGNVPAFDGVDFLDSRERRVRFARNADGKCRAFLFEPGQKTGTLIGDGCAVLKLKEQESEVDGVRNIEGTIAGRCSGGGHAIRVHLHFENCH